MKPPVTAHEVSRHVRDASAGSQAAFTWLHRTFAPLVYSIHLGMGPPAQAEELTQDTFETAFTRLPQLRDGSRFGAWIAAIARRNLPRPRQPVATKEQSEAMPCESSGPDDSAEAERVLRTIQSLPEAYRETLMLRLVEGMSGPEIAALTGLTPPSVRINLHRGMAKLRAALRLPGAHEENCDAHEA